VTGELEHGAVAAQCRPVSVDFITEIAQSAAETAAQFGECDLGAGLHPVLEEELDVGAVFRDDGHDLGQVDCRKFCDLLAEDIFREVEAMTGDVTDRAAHFLDF